jgi:hypothetical protein
MVVAKSTQLFHLYKKLNDLIIKNPVPESFKPCWSEFKIIKHKNKPIKITLCGVLIIFITINSFEASLVI